MGYVNTQYHKTTGLHEDMRYEFHANLSFLNIIRLTIYQGQVFCSIIHGPSRPYPPSFPNKPARISQPVVSKHKKTEKVTATTTKEIKATFQRPHSVYWPTFLPFLLHHFGSTIIPTNWATRVPIRSKAHSATLPSTIVAAFNGCHGSNPLPHS
jgi:hypothetical protein